MGGTKGRCELQGYGCVTKAELQAENDRLKLILQRLFPNNTPGRYFIAGEGGDKDRNGLPERIHVCPAYGCDWTVVYSRNKE